MAKQITVSDHDYDILKLRAGSEEKIKFIISNLIKLSDQAAIELYKYEKWSEAGTGTGAKVPAEQVKF